VDPAEGTRVGDDVGRHHRRPARLCFQRSYPEVLFRRKDEGARPAQMVPQHFERLLAEKPLTLQEIGDKYGISRERVRQIEERLKKRLRLFLEDQVKDLREGVLDLD
jgi:hypothetical protein